MLIIKEKTPLLIIKEKTLWCVETTQVFCSDKYKRLKNKRTNSMMSGDNTSGILQWIKNALKLTKRREVIF